MQGTSGTTGNSLFDAFQEIMGETVYMPVCTEVLSDEVNNTVYRVINIVAVKIREVKLTGQPDSRYIRVEIVQDNSSAFILDENAPVNNSLQKLRLVE